MKERCQVIILKTVKFGESDLICRMLTRQGAKLSVVAKGALRSKKRFGGGVLQATHVVEASYNVSRKAESSLGFLTEASLVEDFKELRLDYDRLQASFFFLRCIDKVSQEGYELPTLYNLLANALKALAEGKEERELKTHFQIKLLYSQGVLNPENWQREYLSLPLREECSKKASIQQHLGVDLLTENYLNTAEGDDLEQSVPR